MLAGFAFPGRGVDEAAVISGPRLIVRGVPVLAPLDEDDRLPPQRRVGGVVRLLERFQSVLTVGQVRLIGMRAVADASETGMSGLDALLLVKLRLCQIRL